MSAPSSIQEPDATENSIGGAGLHPSFKWREAHIEGVDVFGVRFFRGVFAVGNEPAESPFPRAEYLGGAYNDDSGIEELIANGATGAWIDEGDLVPCSYTGRLHRGSIKTSCGEIAA